MCSVSEQQTTVNNPLYSQYNQVPLFIPLQISARAGHPLAQKLCSFPVATWTSRWRRKTPTETGMFRICTLQQNLKFPTIITTGNFNKS
jgi:hypothetical protein